MATFEEHKHERKFIERKNDPRTAHKPVTSHMAKQKTTADFRAAFPHAKDASVLNEVAVKSFGKKAKSKALKGK